MAWRLGSTAVRVMLAWGHWAGCTSDQRNGAGGSPRAAQKASLHQKGATNPEATKKNVCESLECYMDKSCRYLSRLGVFNICVVKGEMGFSDMCLAAGWNKRAAWPLLDLQLLKTETAPVCNRICTAMPGLE